MEAEQSIEHALKAVKELMSTPPKSAETGKDVLELTEDDLFDELDEDYKCDLLEDKIEIKTNCVDEDLTKIDHASVRQENLVSEENAAKSAATIRNLIKKMEQPLIEKVKLTKNITLEEITTEALKPFLKDWLNQHLPEIVQRIVEDEVRKLIPKKD
jgi:cell pole-organizing protein PopZ